MGLSGWCWREKRNLNLKEIYACFFLVIRYVNCIVSFFKGSRSISRMTSDEMIKSFLPIILH